MTSSRGSIATWRRMLLIGITALAASLAVSFATPQDAKAFYVDNAVPANHIGWVHTRGLPIPMCPVARPGEGTCPMPTHDAWRWTGRSWSQASIGGGTQVYVYPYSGSWHWIWTERTGWLAIQNSALVRSQFSCGYLCALR